MSDVHDDALTWAQTNPTDPRAQHIQAKAWAAKNPDDPRAGQILTKLGTPPPSPDNNPDQSFMDRVKDPQRWQAIATNTGPYSNPGIVAGSAPLAMPAALAPGLASLMGKVTGTVAGRIGAGAAQGAIQQAAHSDPETHMSPEDRLHAAESGAVFGGLLQGGGEGLSALAKSPAAIASLVKKVPGLSGRTTAIMKLLGTSAKEEIPEVVAAAPSVSRGKFDPFTKKPVGAVPKLPEAAAPASDSTGESSLTPMYRSALQDYLNRK